MPSFSISQYCDELPFQPFVPEVDISTAVASRPCPLICSPTVVSVAGRLFPAYSIDATPSSVLVPADSMIRAPCVTTLPIMHLRYVFHALAALCPSLLSLPFAKSTK